MAYIVWSDMYTIEVPHIDAQHRQLLDIVNNFHAVVKAEQGQKPIFEVLNSLIHYSQEHFADEEALMERSSYPPEEMEKHKEIHEKLVSDIFQLHEQLTRDSRTISYDLEIFLNEWLIQHILLVDKKLGPHCDKVRDFPGRNHGV